MSLIAKSSSEINGPIEATPIGLQRAVCSHVLDLGLHDREWQGKKSKKHQIAMVFELDKKMTVEKYVGKPFILTKMYTLSLAPKANLTRDISTWTSQIIPEDAEFDVETLKGKGCQLNVALNKKGYGNVVAIMPDSSETPIAIVDPDTYPEWISKFQVKGGVVPAGEGASVDLEDDEEDISEEDAEL